MELERHGSRFDLQGNVLILTYWSLDDALIQTYTLPYVRIIKKLVGASATIHLVTLEKHREKMKGESRTRSEQSLGQDGIGWIPLKYHPFGAVALMRWAVDFIRLSFLIARQRVSVVHCWGTPAGAVGFALSLFTARKLVIDSYEPHAEAMVENGTWKRTGLAFRILDALEKLQTKRATVLIAANAGMKNYAAEKYGVRLSEMLVKPACVDLNLFHPRLEKDTSLLKELGLEDKRVAVYAGKFGGIYLDREVFAFFKMASVRWGDQFRVLLLTNQPETEIAGWCAEAQLDRSLIVTRFVPHNEVPRYLGVADFAITPVKPVPTKRYCTPIKDGEYWAMGLPVVIPSGISNDSEIIQNHRIGAVLDRLDETTFSSALDTIGLLLDEPREQLQQRIHEVAIRYRSFSIAEEVYRQVYRS